MKKKYLLLLSVGGVACAALLFFLKLKRKQGGKAVTNEKGRATAEQEAQLTSSADIALNGWTDSKYNRPILNNYNPNGKNAGQRSNNPANIRASADEWQGAKGVCIAGKNGKFVVFESNIYGARAAFRLLKNYISSGANTINKIITKWAPSSDGNNTVNYINTVVKNTGIAKDTVINYGQEKNIIAILRAMIAVETAQNIGDNNLKIAYEKAK